MMDVTKIVRAFVLFYIPFFLFGTDQVKKPINVIMIMGGSCSGKSTIAKHLKKQFILHGAGRWEVVDFDDVGESMENVINLTKKLVRDGVNVIVDTNTYEDWMGEVLAAQADVFKVLIYASLDVLLARNELRTKRLNRDEHRAFWAKDFVEKSFETSKKWKTDLQIDTNKVTAERCCEQIITCLKK